MMPISVPVGSQMLHAVGLAWAERYQGADRIAITFMGEGASSEGEFHEACNLAGVWKAGVVILRAEQPLVHLPAVVEAERKRDAGGEGVRLRVSRASAWTATTSLPSTRRCGWPRDRARAGDGPTLIEGLTYRLGAHTTSDDPTKYRTDDEVKQWEKRDPLLRLEQ